MDCFSSLISGKRLAASKALPTPPPRPPPSCASELPPDAKPPRRLPAPDPTVYAAPIPAPRAAPASRLPLRLESAPATPPTAVGNSAPSSAAACDLSLKSLVTLISDDRPRSLATAGGTACAPLFCCGPWAGAPPNACGVGRFLNVSPTRLPIPSSATAALFASGARPRPAVMSTNGSVTPVRDFTAPSMLGTVDFVTCIPSKELSSRPIQFLAASLPNSKALAHLQFHLRSDLLILESGSFLVLAPVSCFFMPHILEQKEFCRLARLPLGLLSVTGALRFPPVALL